MWSKLQNGKFKISLIFFEKIIIYIHDSSEKNIMIHVSKILYISLSNIVDT